MKFLKAITVLMFLFGARFLHAQTAVIPVYSCENPGVKAVTSGASSSNYLQGIVPQCLVTVYLTGTTTLATIYKDSLNTPQNNPFTANFNGSIPPIYALTGQGYDVVLSGGNAPNTYSASVTLVDVFPGINLGDVVCNNPSQTIPQTQTYICFYWTGTNSTSPNIGQNGITFAYMEDNLNITGPGSNPGINGSINNFNETGGGVLFLNTNSYQRGNHTGFGTQLNSYGAGDAQGANINVTSFADAIAGADEGPQGVRSQVSQYQYSPNGTITSGASTGSNLINTTVTIPFNDQGFLLDTSQPAGTATITAITPAASPPGIHSGTLTVTGISVTPSTAWGLMVPSTVTYASSPVGVYQNYVSATATMTIQSGAFTVGAMACAGNNLEYMQITSVGAVFGGTQSVTFNTRNGWDGTQGNTNQAQCMQGGSVIGKAFVATSTLSTWPVAYALLGATNSTTLVYGNCSAGQCNAIATSNFVSNYTAISLFPYAEIIGTNNNTAGVVQLGYNNIPFTLGDTIVGAPAAAAELTGYHLNMNIKTPSIYNQTQDILDGPQSIGFLVDDMGTQPINQYFSAFNSFPVYNAPTAWLSAIGSFQNDMLMFYSPASGGCMMCALNDNSEGASFTGSVNSGATLLTVTARASGFIMPNEELNATGITQPCLIGSYTAGSGTPGGIGTYSLIGCTGTASSESMTTTKGLYTVFGVKNIFSPVLTYDATTRAAVLNVAGGTGTLSLPQTTTIPTLKVGSGTYTVYRCTTAGTLPIGALTVTSSDCGVSTATTLSVN